MKPSHLTVALAGNPNSGKSTIFNAITGSRQHVGNYPGVTVEKMEGRASHNGVELEVVDLPGTYSLTAYSIEEIVARNFILDEEPDVVVDIIDSSNLERNLYLATQLIELGRPLVLAFNMSDVARARGWRIDIEKISALLGVPVVATVGHKNKGTDKLLDAVIAAGAEPRATVARQRLPNYGGEIQPHVDQLAELVVNRYQAAQHQRWFAVKLLEGDEETIKRLRKLCPDHVEELLGRAGRLRRHIEGLFGDPAEIVLADRRYGFISGACTEAVQQTVETRHERSDKIDAVLTNRYLGLPVFAVLMYLMFQLTFAIGTPIIGYLEAGKEMLAGWVRSMGAPESLLINLLAGGVIEGVGAVLVFLPLIALLYLGISILEDSGYMARAAFVLDKLMHTIGLHGKSFIPMLIGFGCTVPAVMATRILTGRRDRLTTMLVLPLMSCGARLPIYVLIIAAFFPKRTIRLAGPLEVSNQALLLFGIYVIGIVLAVISALILRKTILRGESASFVMELPPYRLPTLKGLVVHVSERSWQFVKKAGTIILAVVIVLWALNTWPKLGESDKGAFEAQRTAVRADAALSAAQARCEIQRVNAAQHRAELTNSATGRIGRLVAPILAPCGFDWKISTALLGACAAKEVFIGQMGVLYALAPGAGEESASLRQKLAADYAPLQGFCIMLFILIASPCAATVAVTLRESGSWKWALLQWAYLTAAAWVITTLVFQLGSLAELGTKPLG